MLLFLTMHILIVATLTDYRTAERHTCDQGCKDCYTADTSQVADR